MKLKDSRVLASLVAAVSLIYLALVTQLGPAPAAGGQRRQEPPPARREVRRAIVISLDGLDVRYLRRADELKLKIPTLRRLMREGVSAGVESVYPSVTYPNHTTMVTGARPDRHAIVNNDAFVPPTSPQAHGWYWFARDIKADTLWEAARRAGVKTGLVSWPVSTGAGDWNVPEIWKAGSSPADFPTTLAEISRHARPAGLVEEIHRRHPDIYRNVTRDEGDDMRARWAEYIIREKRPELTLVHLFDLDHAEHDHGPFSPQALAILEKVDGYVARIIAAAEEAGTLPETAVFIVSDHGFRDVSKIINPAPVLAQAGLVRTDGGAVTDWRAYPYASGGACAIVLRDPSDRDAHARALTALQTFNEREGGKLFTVVPKEEVRRLGAFPGAAFVLDAAPGYYFDNKLKVAPVSDAGSRGMHGYLPGSADYRATFVATGLDVIRRGDLGDIHMTDVGPTVASVLGLNLRDVQGQAVRLK